jgi:PAS domain S-box-containing protein
VLNTINTNCTFKTVQMNSENKILSIFSIIVLALILITVFSYQSINKANIISEGILLIAIVIFLMLFIIRDLRKRIQLEKDLIKAKELAETMYEAQQAVNKELANYKYAFDQSSIVAITDQKGIIRYADDNFCKISKFSREELIGQDHRMMNSVYHTKEYIRNQWTAIANGKVWKGEFKNKAKDGTIYWVDTTIIPFLDEKGKTYQYFAVGFDISKRKKIEKELIQAKETAEKLVGFKDQFLANMSHEIRTPLNGIIGFTKILLRNGITEKQKHQLSAIKTSSDILLVLVSDILDLAKIEAGKMTLETTELKVSDLVISVLSIFEVRIEEKELKLKKQYDKRIPQILLGDPARISQILLNLLSNAVKFTHQGGQISISINLKAPPQPSPKGREEDSALILNPPSGGRGAVSIEFIVSDTGIGISPDKLAIIFEPFMQSSSDTGRIYGGTGLGLNIVKRLVDLMGGTISVKSKLNEGSAFTFTLPLKKTTATEVSKEKESIILTGDIKQLGKLKILLAEDISVNQFLAQTILHDFGFESDTAENGKIAIELLEKNNYDIILMDLQMPEMNGWEATKHIRSKMQPPKSTIPIIALTADITKSDVDKCKELGMDDYVSKPINETDLLNKILRLVKEKRKPLLISAEGEKPTADQQTIKSDSYRICNLDYLKSHSPNNPKFVKEMIQMLLEQTPVIIEEINKCLATADWNGLHGNVHKMKPSLDLIGLPKDITVAALQMEEYAREQEHLDLIPALLLKLEKALEQAYKELEEELRL